MSKKHSSCDYKEECCCNYGGMNYGSYSNIYSLLILILIVLQFGSCCKFWGDDDDDHCKGKKIDNSILFIIAIFLLIYCSCGKKNYNYGCC